MKSYKEHGIYFRLINHHKKFCLKPVNIVQYFVLLLDSLLPQQIAAYKGHLKVSENPCCDRYIQLIDAFLEYPNSKNYPDKTAIFNVYIELFSFCQAHFPENYIIKNRTAYSNLMKPVLKIYAQRGLIMNQTATESLEATLQEPLLLDVKKALSVEAVSSYYFFNGLINFFLGKREKSYEHYRTLLTYLEDNGYIHQANLKRYVSGTINYINSCVETERKSEVLHHLNKFHRICRAKGLKLKKKDKLELLMQQTAFELIEMVKEKHFDDARKFIEEKKQLIVENDTLINNYAKVYVFYYMAWVAYHMKDPREALYLSEKLFFVEEVDSLKEIYVNNRVLRVIIYYEMKAKDYMRRAINEMRLSAQRDREYIWEAIFINMMVDLLNTRSNQSKIEAVLKQNLIRFKAIYEDARWKNLDKYFEIIPWIEHQISLLESNVNQPSA